MNLYSYHAVGSAVLYHEIFRGAEPGYKRKSYSENLQLRINNKLYTQVDDNGRFMNLFFWYIIYYYSQDAHWMMMPPRISLDVISKWYIIFIICYL